MKLLPLVTLLAMVPLAACGKKDEKTETAAAAKEEAEIPKDVGDLKIKPLTLFKNGDKAVASAGAKLGKAVGNDGSTALALDEGGDIACDPGTAIPKDAKDSTKNTSGPGLNAWLPDTDPRFSIGRFYCALAINTGNPTTAQGSFELPKAFACAVGKLTTAKFDGKETDQKLTIDQECFGKFLGEDTGNTLGDKIPVKLKLSAPATVAGWDYEFDVKTLKEGSAFTARFLFKSTDTTLAFAVHTTGTQAVGSDLVMTSIDKKSGELRHIFRREKVNCAGKSGADLETCPGTLVASDPDEWEGGQHFVVLAKGKFGADFAFQDIASVEGYESSLYAQADGVSGLAITAKGTLAGGITTRTFKNAAYGSWADFSKVANHPEHGAATSPYCHKDASDPVAGACAGNAGLAYSKDADLASYLHPAFTGYKPNSALFKSVKPLDYKSVSPSDLNL